MPYTPNYAPGDVLTAAAMNSIGEAWGTFGTTANFKATTTNPTLGTGGAWSMNYCQVNKVVFVRGRITWGGTGLNLGTGAYRIDLPVTAKSTGAGNTWGTAYLYDPATPDIFPCQILAPSTTQVAVYWSDSAAADTRLVELSSLRSPLTFFNGCWIDYSFTYEAA